MQSIVCKFAHINCFNMGLKSWNMQLKIKWKANSYTTKNMIYTPEWKNVKENVNIYNRKENLKT
jgi:uncharacterized protein Usg